ncbi:MAG: hybrid sensor histidine kinase/response regulator [Bacteroidales bacterium]
MKLKESLESNIRFNAALIYFVVGLVCCIMVFYLYNIRGNIETQKQQIEQHRKTLALTNKMVYVVSEIQSAGNLYISTKNERYLKTFNHKILQIGLIIDSISICTNKPVQETGLLKLDTLLRKQYVIIRELGKRLGEQNPLIEVNKKLQNYNPIIKRDSILITTTKQDTIVNPAPKRGFFKRLAKLFVPGKDSVIVLSHKKIDTLNVARKDTLSIIPQIDSAVRMAGEGYSKNVKAIEFQVGVLAVSDQKIMEKISNLVLGMYGKTLNSIMLAIDNSERIIDRNYTYSIIAGIGALILGMIFIVLIILGVNRNKEVMESRHKLLLSVSHDIKTPLGSILGYLELKRKDGYDVRSMQSSGNYILSLLENLIEFSSIEQGKLKISNTPFNLGELFTGIAEMFEPLAIKKGIAFEYNIDFSNEQLHNNSELILCLDQLKIKQIVVNILSNAVKYTTTGSVKLYVSYKDEKLLCKITDTGAGIPDSYKEKIFAPFQRVEKNNILADGSGLGLYVVKGLVDLLHGEMFLTSQVGKGSEFTVVIPAKSVENNISKGLKHITIIDDDPVLLSMTAEMLSSLGHKVTTVSKIDDIDKCDIILADMEMGHFTGVDVLKNAKEVPVVIMTARSDFGAEDARKLGFAAYLSKPFTLASLQSIFDGNSKIAELFGNDIESMRETLSVFKSATAANIILLQKALRANDYIAARATCHKMLPMFAQLGYDKIAEIMRKVEVHRNDEYDGWQKDIECIISNIADSTDILNIIV